MKVKDFMIKDVISVKPTTTLHDLLKTFIEHGIGGVPVLDDDLHLVGMISDGDVIRYLSPRPEKVHDLFYSVYVQEGEKEKDVLAKKMGTKVEDIISKVHRIVTVKDDDEFEEAIRLLSKHHFKKLPVLDEEGKVIGVISRGDIIMNLAKLILDEN